MARLSTRETPIKGLLMIERRVIADERGAFARLFCHDELAGLGFGAVAQINHSLTRSAGAIRGLHFQRGAASDAKIVTCIAGRVFDVPLDLRPGSPTYGRWHGEVLAADQPRALLIPAGFAHGFQVLEPDSALIYLHDRPHEPGAEGGVQALDPALAIAWPLQVSLMSERDRALPLFGRHG